jgi:DNA repair exonuclease SbcCD ATPase subunit
MFRIVSVEIEGFKSFSTKQTFALPKKPGLYFVTGENKLHPRLGANGVGKSTLLDSIFWCLYGRTPRGLKAGDIISRGAKHARVAVAMMINSVATVVTRTQAPNSLTLEQNGKGHPVDQDAIDKALRLNAEAFEVSVIRPQFGKSFLELKPAEKLTLFSQIMGLDFWLEKSKIASDLARELKVDQDRHENLLANCKGQISVLEADIDSLKSQELTFEKDRKLQCAQQLSLASDQADRKAILEKQLNRLEKTYLTISREYESFDKKLEVLASKLTELGSAIGKVEGKQHGQITIRRKIQDTLAKLPEAGATCPHCQQSMPKLHLKAEQVRLNREIKGCDEHIEELNVEIEELNKHKQDVFKRIGQLKHNKIEIGTSRTEIASQISKTRTDLGNATANIERIREIVADLKGKGNPYAELILEKRKALKHQKGLKEELTTTIKETSEEHVAVSYWINGFKKLRLFIIEQTLKQLEIEINNNLASLGMPEWGITLDVERENKAGGVTKGFVVFVHAPDSKAPVRFEAWSGGETQRLCLAGDMGLANLILERAGLISKIEFYDEPSTHLSTEGLQDLAETLAQRAEDQDKSIFLIDHTIIEFGGFAGAVKIVKDGKGSRIDLG